MPVIARREHQHEVARVVLDVAGHWMPIESILIGRNDGPLEAVAGGAADAQEDAEAGLGLERPVADEGEVAGLAAELERADLDLRADRAEGDRAPGSARAPVLSLKSPAVTRSTTMSRSRACRS